jgi:hypothetical protein
VLHDLAKQFHRTIPAPAPHRHDPQLRHRRDVGSVERKDAAVPSLGRDDVAAQQGEVAEPAERFDLIRDELQHALAQFGRLGVLPLLDAHVGERQQGLCELRVLARHALEDRRGFRRAAERP